MSEALRAARLVPERIETKEEGLVMFFLHFHEVMVFLRHGLLQTSSCEPMAMAQGKHEPL